MKKQWKGQTPTRDLSVPDVLGLLFFFICPKGSLTHKQIDLNAEPFPLAVLNFLEMPQVILRRFALLAWRKDV